VAAQPRADAASLASDAGQVRGADSASQGSRPATAAACLEHQRRLGTALQVSRQACSGNAYSSKRIFNLIRLIVFQHDNKTGDEYLKKYFLESDVGKEMVSYMKWNVAKFLFKTALVTGAVIFEKKNDFRITKALFSATRAKLQI
jgi:hypothetical protein